MSSLVRSLGPIGDWLKSRGESSPTSEWRNAKRVWVEFTGTDLTVIDSRGTQDGAFPAPGVTGVEVAFKGSLGSLREVTVNYQCWTKAQLEQMSTAFMQLGKGSLVIPPGKQIRIPHNPEQVISDLQSINETRG